ncbi:glycosyltransferase family 4 protein [Rosenbergiella epipactidis]|uniref:glycosyltransferase family 4 protein n=1 Tax=Rosenbergiella epipactidis TaxID=1544694 RepID=UPI001F4D5E88|nr:glycosyltransferase family 4 protein [Rosenbergiella epipactidis]
MKKIAIVIQDAYSYAGTENVCNFMTDSLGENNHIEIISLCGSGSPFYPFNKINKINSFHDKWFKYIRIIGFLKKNKFDIVYVISMGKLSFIFMVFSKVLLLSKIKKISCEHVSFRSFSKYIRLLKLWALKGYDEVIVLTSEDEVFLKERSVKTKKIYNPITFKNHIYKVEEKRVLAVGRLVFQKGYDDLLLIWKSFVKNNPSWTLDIAGDGELFDHLQQVRKSFGIENSVNFLGKIEDVDYFYKRADLFVMTSKYEGLPLSLLEAKSWSIPSVAFDCPTGPSEIINNSIDGFLVPPENIKLFIERLDYLAKNNEIRNEFRKKTLITSEKFAKEKIILEWLQTTN